jgi:hypothetical protein
MEKLSGHLDLAEKTGGPDRRRKIVREDFDCNLSVVFQIAREIDGSHCAAPDLALDHVAAAQGGAESFRKGVSTRSVGCSGTRHHNQYRLFSSQQPSSGQYVQTVSSSAFHRHLTVETRLALSLG